MVLIKKLQHNFVINVGYCITETCVTSNINTSIHNNRDIFYDEMVSIFFMNTIAKPQVKRLRDAVRHLENRLSQSLLQSMTLQSSNHK